MYVFCRCTSVDSYNYFRFSFSVHPMTLQGGSYRRRRLCAITTLSYKVRVASMVVTLLIARSSSPAASSM